MIKQLENQLKSVRDATKREQPLIHCITNPISIHGCANMILAVGARPMMAEHPMEVEGITKTAGALMLNLGNITDVRIESHEAFRADGGERRNSGSAGSGRRILQ